MITKEFRIKKYCCFYASDFHLEMILLPFIKNNLYKSRIFILTQENLSESVKKVLDRTNLDIEEKNQILNLNWSSQKIESFNIEENDTLIVNGDKNYIDEINNVIESFNLRNITMVDCYNINKIEEKKFDIKNEYEGILNTNYITN